MDITSKKMEETYRVVKYTFSFEDVENEHEAMNIALRFFVKYFPHTTIRQQYIEGDWLNREYNIYIAY